jgi:Zn-dependent oligopeptidase
VDILLDITATSGLKFSMLTLLNSSKKRNLQEVATKFKDNILSKGGTEHPMSL